MYLLLDKFIFLHLPRTGSTSHIYSMLDTDQSFSPVFDDFSPAIMGKYYLKERYDNHYIMAMIRNPWDREVSLWRWLTTGLLDGVDMDFDYWVKWRYTSWPSEPASKIDWVDPQIINMVWTMHKTPQVFYLVDELGRFIVDYIGDYNSRPNDLANLKQPNGWMASWSKWHWIWQTKFGVNPDTLKSKRPLQHNKSNLGGIDYKYVYNEDSTLIDIIQSNYEWDIKTFGYEFDKGSTQWTNRDLNWRKGFDDIPTKENTETLSKLPYTYQHVINTGHKLMLHNQLSYPYQPSGFNRNVLADPVTGLPEFTPTDPDDLTEV